MNGLASERKAYHDWIAAEGPHQAHVSDAVDAYVAALEAEIERHKAHARIQARLARKAMHRATALEDLVNGMGVVLDDPRLSYVEVQLDREDLRLAQEALAEEAQDGK